MALGYTIGQPVMMQLGSYQFGISTAAYQELARSSEYRWPGQERFGQLSALQFTGPGDDTIVLPGVIYPEWRGGLNQVNQLRALAAEGKPQSMVDGNGASLGLWVIESVTETQTVFADAGAPRRMEFSLSLRRAPDAPPAAASATDGTAIGGASVPAGASGAVAKVQGLAGGISSAAKSLSGALSKAAQQVEQVVQPIAAAGRDALGGVLRAAAVVNELQTTANRTLALVGVRPIEITALAGAEHLASTAAGLLASAESASALLRNSSARMAQLSALPAEAASAMRGAQAAADRAVSLTRQTAAEAAKIKG